MDSTFQEPVNIGNDYTVSVDELAHRLIQISGYPVDLEHIVGIEGVRGRNSDNTLANKVLPQWAPEVPLSEGLQKTYLWIEKQVNL